MNYDAREWMTYHEAAAFWGVSYMVALHRIDTRQMPRQHVGRQALVQRAAVEAWRPRMRFTALKPLRSEREV